MRQWLVGGALITNGDGLLLVANRRRNDSVDWSPPGGVIDEGESLHEGLAREVTEETGLTVAAFERCAYRVEVVAPGLGWRLRVEAWEAAVVGDIRHADPDGIVEASRFVSGAAAVDLLSSSPLWISVPVGAWLGQQMGSPSTPPTFRFRLNGSDRRTAVAEQLGSA